MHGRHCQSHVGVILAIKDSHRAISTDPNALLCRAVESEKNMSIRACLSPVVYNMADIKATILRSSLIDTGAEQLVHEASAFGPVHYGYTK